jgi:hypothetical protein
MPVTNAAPFVAAVRRAVTGKVRELYQCVWPAATAFRDSERVSAIKRLVS